MDYKKHYDKLIEKHGIEEKPCYYSERHHVVPKCMGGSDELSNLVYLKPKAHFTAHFLLWKIYRSPKLGHAFNMMCNNTSQGSQRGSRNYSIARKAHSEAMSESNPMFDPVIVAKISGDNHYMKQDKWKDYFSEQRLGRNNPMFGRKNPSRYRKVMTPTGEYGSLVAAAEGNNLSRSSVMRYLKDARKEEWCYIDQA